MQTDEFRRHRDGSIDYDFYRKSAAALRRQAFRDTAARMGGGRIAAIGASLAAVLLLAAFSVPAAKLVSASYASATTTQIK